MRWVEFGRSLCYGADCTGFCFVFASAVAVVVAEDAVVAVVTVDAVDATDVTSVTSVCPERLLYRVCVQLRGL